MSLARRVTSRRPGLLLLAAAALVVLGTWLRARHLGGPDLGFDEFYHVSSVPPGTALVAFDYAGRDP